MPECENAHQQILHIKTISDVNKSLHQLKCFSQYWLKFCWYFSFFFKCQIKWKHSLDKIFPTQIRPQRNAIPWKLESIRKNSNQFIQNKENYKQKNTHTQHIHANVWTFIHMWRGFFVNQSIGIHIICTNSSHDAWFWAVEKKKIPNTISLLDRNLEQNSTNEIKIESKIVKFIWTIVSWLGGELYFNHNVFDSVFELAFSRHSFSRRIS